MGYFRYKLKTKIKDFVLRFSLVDRPKIFCISLQRTGTTSIGVFFNDHNFRVATNNTNTINHWSAQFIKGDYEAIFKSDAFKSHQVFEDAPWWCADFYKVLFHRFPKARFILIERDADAWFNSMMNHSSQKNPGNTFRHSKNYHRQREFYELNLGEEYIYNNQKDNLLALTEAHRKHYTDFYRIRNYEVREFFKKFGPERLFQGKLSDPDLWTKLADFFEIQLPEGYSVHANKTKGK